MRCEIVGRQVHIKLEGLEEPRSPRNNYSRFLFSVESEAWIQILVPPLTDSGTLPLLLMSSFYRLLFYKLEIDCSAYSVGLSWGLQGTILAHNNCSVNIS